ncbi:MAG TPA: cytidylate kinase-like family protein [Ktedonobacteraceae bacterium]|jgi:cytidylate kinase|nr:cytidylate kinase-like family protein [Ktedonobacteraceae bacterium]
MAAQQEMRVITISRQYGSGGGEIAVRVAKRLSWQLVDHEIVAQVARRLGITEEEASIHDERVEGFIARALNALQIAVPVVPLSPTTSPAQEERVYHEALRQVVETAANAGNVVIVGRAGQSFLAQRRDVLHVRVVAPLQQRIAYVAQREGLDEATAQARIATKDRDRARYLQTQHHLNVNDPLLYDLIINTHVIDLEGAVDLILLALERKGRMLGVPTGQLGAVTGLPRYPGRPGDLRPPTSNQPSGPLPETGQ